MQRYLSALARILLAQVFLLQVIMLVIGFFSTLDGYQQSQLSLGSLGLPGIFAPLIILVQLVGGLSLILGYKTRFFSLFYITFFICNKNVTINFHFVTFLLRLGNICIFVITLLHLYYICYWTLTGF